MTFYILDDDGCPRVADDLVSAARFMENRQRHVGRDIANGVTVSTVFLCIDHSFGDGPPVLWETMVFGGKFDEEQERYTSREDAVSGHYRWCLRALGRPPGARPDRSGIVNGGGSDAQ